MLPVAIPCLLGSAIIVSVLWCVYVCADERGFTSGTNLDRILREYERMKREAPAAPARSDWQDDGM